MVILSGPTNFRKEQFSVVDPHHLAGTELAKDAKANIVESLGKILIAAQAVDTSLPNASEKLTHLQMDAVKLKAAFFAIEQHLPNDLRERVEEISIMVSEKLVAMGIEVAAPPNPAARKTILRWNLEVLIRMLKNSGCMTSEGLFRVSGSKRVIDDVDLTKKINEEELQRFTNGNVDTLAGILKKMFRDMPNPLLALIEPELAGVLDPTANIGQLKEIVKTLPFENYETLNMLLGFLREASENCEHTKMTSFNLAICIIPNLVVGGLINGINPNTIACMIAMIDHHNKIFH